METKGNKNERAKIKPIKSRLQLPVIEDIENCNFHGMMPIHS